MRISNLLCCSVLAFFGMTLTNSSFLCTAGFEHPRSGAKRECWRYDNCFKSKCKKT